MEFNGFNVVDVDETMEPAARERIWATAPFRPKTVVQVHDAARTNTATDVDMVGFASVIESPRLRAIVVLHTTKLNAHLRNMQKKVGMCRIFREVHVRNNDMDTQDSPMDALNALFHGGGFRQKNRRCNDPGFLAFLVHRNILTLEPVGPANFVKLMEFQFRYVSALSDIDVMRASNARCGLYVSNDDHQPDPLRIDRSSIIEPNIFHYSVPPCRVRFKTHFREPQCEKEFSYDGMTKKQRVHVR